MAQSSIRPRKRKVSADEFIEAAEAPAAPSQQELPQQNQAEARASKGPKFGIYTLRGTESQRELLRYAAKKKGISQNEVIASYLFAALEEEFGEEVPF